MTGQPPGGQIAEKQMAEGAEPMLVSDSERWADKVQGHERSAAAIER